RVSPLEPIAPRDRNPVDAGETRRRDRSRGRGGAEPPAHAARRERAIRLTDKRGLGRRGQHGPPGGPLHPLPQRHGPSLGAAAPGRAATGAGPPPGVPATVIATAPSVTRACATPPFATTWPGGASASTRTPRGTSARPGPKAVRCRSLTTSTSRPGRGSAST